MLLLNIPIIAFSLFGINIYWYGIIYSLSILLVWKFSAYIIRNIHCSLTIQELDKFMFVGIVLCVVGARLGHIFFFEPKYYLGHLSEIVAVRNGGMSFHGGVVGLALAIIWFSRKFGFSMLMMTDILSFAGCIGIFLGRIANFVNQELYGVVTSVEWAVIFSNVDHFPRHPTQLYESIFEGLFSFWIMLILWNTRYREKIGSGIYTFTFLFVYSVARFIIESFKEVDIVSCFNGTISLTIGQILSIFLFIISLFVLKLGWSRQTGV